LDEPELDEELPQAAMSSAALLAIAVAATTLVTERKKTTSFVGGTSVGTGLLREPIGLSRGVSNRLPLETLEGDR
jgi:hypothetical protein